MSHSTSGMKTSATFERIFVTVGTTEFNELIASIDDDDFVTLLRALGCGTLVLQYGRGEAPSNLHDLCYAQGIKYNSFRFQPDLHEEMMKSDLILSHCGAGSILEAMNMLKPLIVVVNSSLQGNHQSELSDQLAIGGHCLETTPSRLFNCLQRIISGETDVESFCHPFPDADLDLFPAVVDSLFNF